MLLQARDLARACGDPETEAHAAIYLGYRALQGDQLEQAADLIGAAAARLVDPGWSSGLAWCEFGLGWVAVAKGDPAEAALRFERMLEVAHQGGHDVLVTHALAALAPLAAAGGEAERALALADDAVDFARRLELRQVLIMTLARAAETALALGEPTTAVKSLREAISLLYEVGARTWLRGALGLAAVVSVHGSRHAEAARLLGAAQGGGIATPASLPAAVGPARQRIEAILGTERMATELAAGAAMTVDESLLFALEQLQ
jgi:tetratricopeptide (TPR) repeat protein